MSLSGAALKRRSSRFYDQLAIIPVHTSLTENTGQYRLTWNDESGPRGWTCCPQYWSLREARMVHRVSVSRAFYVAVCTYNSDVLACV